MPLNNNSMYGYSLEEDGTGARNSSSTRSISGDVSFGGVGDENDGSPNSQSAQKKKKGMFYYFIVHIVCILFIVCIFNSYN